MTAKKKIFYIIFLIGIFIPNNINGQNNLPREDIHPKITLEKFNELVIQSVNLLENKKLDEITDSEHIQIMMCINTVQMLRNKLSKEISYKKLLKLEKTKDYGNELSKNIYKDWIPNRGMGFYFRKLKMELNGTPGNFAWYDLE